MNHPEPQNAEPEGGDSNTPVAPPSTFAQALRIRLQVAVAAEQTAVLLRRSTLRLPKDTAGEDGFYEVSWGELRQDILRLGALLAESGVGPGTPVVQVAENSYEWVVLDLALHALRAVHVPIHASLTGSQIAYQVLHSETRHVLLSGPEQSEKLAEYLRREEAAADSEAWSQIQWFAYAPCEAPVPAAITLLAEALPRADEQAGAHLLEQAATESDPEDLATILYTSGTTGEPKGVMLTQKNLVSNTVATLEALPPERDDVRLCFLPLSHIFARTCDLYTWLMIGLTPHTAPPPSPDTPPTNLILALAESRETVMRDLAEVRPTMISGVPYFYSKLAQGLAEAGHVETPGALRQMLGGRIRICAGGGAALPRHVYDLFCKQEVPLLQGYGLTETSPVISVSSLTHVRADASGKPIPGVEVKISDGEILTRGPHVMRGYFKDPEATAAVIRDGWFHTGDLGYLDDDGFLFITGRRKELIVTAGGKNVAPVYLESLLTRASLILQAVVVGDDRKYLAALIVPDPDALRKQILERQIPVTSAAEALQHPAVLEWFRQQIADALRDVSHYEQVRRFHLMDRGFTIESGEMTAKLTLRRDVIHRNCADLIEALYCDA